MKTIYNRLLIVSIFLILTISINAQKPEARKTYTIQSAIGGKYLDVKWAKKENGTPFHLWPFNGEVAQAFTIENAGGGYFYIKSAIGKYMHVNGANKNARAGVSIWTGKGNDNTKWKFIDAGNGFCFIQSKLGTNLDVQGGKSADGTPIWMWVANNSNAQKWKFKESLNANLKDIEIVKVENFGEKCITTKEHHSLNGRRHIDNGTELTTTIEWELIENSIRANVTVEFGSVKKFVRASWFKTIYKGDVNFFKRIKGFNPFTGKSNDYRKYWRIKHASHLKESGTEFGFGCNDVETHVFKPAGAILKIIGDTGGEDISDDYNCKCDSRLVDVIFRDTYIEYENIENISLNNTKIPEIDTTSPNYYFKISGDNFNHVFTENHEKENVQINLKANKEYKFSFEVKDEGGIKYAKWVALNDRFMTINVHYQSKIKWNINSPTSQIGKFFEWKDPGHYSAQNRIYISGTIKVKEDLNFGFHFQTEDIGGKVKKSNTTTGKLSFSVDKVNKKTKIRHFF